MCVCVCIGEELEGNLRLFPVRRHVSFSFIYPPEEEEEEVYLSTNVRFLNAETYIAFHRDWDKRDPTDGGGYVVRLSAVC